MVRRYKKLVDEFKIKDELAVVLPRELKDKPINLNIFYFYILNKLSK